MIHQSWRAYVLYWILRIGNAIAHVEATYTEYTDGNATVSVQYERWYQPLIDFGFWLCRIEERP